MKQWAVLHGTAGLLHPCREPPTAAASTVRELQGTQGWTQHQVASRFEGQEETTEVLLGLTAQSPHPAAALHVWSCWDGMPGFPIWNMQDGDNRAKCNHCLLKKIVKDLFIGSD